MLASPKLGVSETEEANNSCSGVHTGMGVPNWGDGQEGVKVWPRRSHWPRFCPCLCCLYTARSGAWAGTVGLSPSSALAGVRP